MTPGLFFLNIYGIKSFYHFIFQVFLIKHVFDMRPFALKKMYIHFKKLLFLYHPLFHKWGQK